MPPLWGIAHPSDKRRYGDDVTTTPVPGWYDDPYQTSQLRYWDGRAWTEHVAAKVNPAAPTPPPTGTFWAPQASAPQATLYTNPAPLPPREAQPSNPHNLTTSERLNVLMIDLGCLLPFVVFGWLGGEAFGALSGDHHAADHAYQSAALVIAVVIGVGFALWNMWLRSPSIGTEFVVERRSQPR